MRTWWPLLLCTVLLGCSTVPAEPEHSLIRAELRCRQINDAPDTPVACTMGKTDFGWILGIIYADDQAVDVYTPQMAQIAAEFCFSLTLDERQQALVVSGNLATNKAFSISCATGRIETFNLQAEQSL